MALSEIEKLERRYAENPTGLTFAPLAEVHRKNGDVTRALDLLKPGLELHPDYIPASIVLGRCHLDLGDLPAAEAAFTHVLALDGENVIALKALADISERLLRLDDAERWLQALLTVDRSNDDAREQLARVEGAKRQAKLGSAVNPEAAAVADGRATGAAPDRAAEGEAATTATAPSAEPSAGVGAEPLRAESERGAPAAAEEGPSDLAWVSEPEASADAMPLMLEELGSPAHEPAEAEPRSPDLMVEEPMDLPEMVEPLPGLIGRDEDAVGVGEEFRVETNEDIVLRSSGGSEFQMPDASEELFAGSSGRHGEPPAAESLASDNENLAPAAEAETVQMGAEPVAEPGRRAEPLVPAEPLVAAEPLVPAQPIGLPEPVRAVQQSTGGEPYAAVAELSHVTRSVSARETGGQSVAEFLTAMLAARLPAAPADGPPRSQASAPPVEASGAPTRPAPDTLSLSAVFGEEPTPVPPAVPAPAAPTGGVSYDEFFGGTSTSSRSAKAHDPKSDDLDQFHAWLQNLKR